MLCLCPEGEASGRPQGVARSLLLFCELAAGAEGLGIAGSTTGEAACPVVPLETAVVGEAEVDAAVRASIVHKAREMVVVEHVVVDVHIVPAVSIADADGTIDYLPTELAVIVVVVAGVDVVVDLIAPATVAVLTLEKHAGAVRVARDAKTVVEIGVDIA